MTYPFVVGAGDRLFGETSGVEPMRLVGPRTVGDSLVLLTYQELLSRPVDQDRLGG
jgi:hypothetical protein